MRIKKEDQILLQAIFNSLMKDTPEPLEQYPDDICEMDIVLADIIKHFLKKKELLPIPRIGKNICHIISIEYYNYRDEVEGIEILAHFYLYKIAIATLLKYRFEGDLEEENVEEENFEDENFEEDDFKEKKCKKKVDKDNLDEEDEEDDFEEDDSEEDDLDEDDSDEDEDDSDEDEDEEDEFN